MTIIDFIIHRREIAEWATKNGYVYQNWSYYKDGKEYSLEEIDHKWSKYLQTTNNK